MTRLEGHARVVRETGAVVKHRPLVVELSALILRIRPKGARWGYELDYESVFILGAKKAAEKERAERQTRKARRRQSR
ncbi:MAG: hypothetical protein U0Q18_17190 [Bryobacteraceae bacterium]